MNVSALITYAARPIQGGRLELAPPKRRLWYAELKLNGRRALIHTPSGTMYSAGARRRSSMGLRKYAALWERTRTRHTKRLTTPRPSREQREGSMNTEAQAGVLPNKPTLQTTASRLSPIP